MIVYRIGRTRFARDLSGEGARLHGGRWNRKMIPCIYTSESRALALLEFTANVNIDEIPRALSISVFEIPDVEILTVPIDELPGNWAWAPAPSSAKEFGSQLLISQKHLVVKLPSAIVQEEFNYLINPLYPANTEVKLLDVKDFVYDVRLKLK